MESTNRRVTSLNNKTNSIDLSLFLPQQNTSMIDRERSNNNLTAHSEKNIDIAAIHKSKTNVAITQIGTMVDMTNFSRLCISNTIISAIIGST